MTYIQRSLLLLILLVPAWGFTENNQIIVATESGAVVGIESSDGKVFKGIPYAAAPVGPLRWRPPQAAASWQGTREALEFGPVCPQPELRPFPAGMTISEDCLSLNVWTPANLDSNSKLPVMVWIHGGGFSIGSGAIHKVFTPGPMPINHFSNFVGQGVVIVTLNYRLGILGVFAHPALSREQADEPLGNYGLLDQIAALKWTQSNIAAFGGDPDNVTLFGQSAGGSSVNALMVSPLSKGLFHRAISQSGAAMLADSTYLNRANGEKASQESQGLKFADTQNISNDEAAAKALRDLPLDAIVGGGLPPMNVFPVVDGKVLPAPTGQLFRDGAQHNIPYMAGANSLDGSVFMRNLGAYDAVIEKIPSAVLSETYGDIPEKVLKMRFAGDKVFVVPSWSLVNHMSNVEAAGYFYQFAYVPESMAADLPGASHGAEMPFVFRNMEWREYPHSPSPVEQALSKTISGFWANFARSGDPNGTGLPQWPAHTKNRDAVMVFNASPAVVEGAISRQVQLHMPLLEPASRPEEN